MIFHLVVPECGLFWLTTWCLMNTAFTKVLKETHTGGPSPRKQIKSTHFKQRLYKKLCTLYIPFLIMLESADLKKVTISIYNTNQYINMRGTELHWFVPSNPWFLPLTLTATHLGLINKQDRNQFPSIRERRQENYYETRSRLEFQTLPFY